MKNKKRQLEFTEIQLNLKSDRFSQSTCQYYKFRKLKTKNLKYHKNIKNLKLWITKSLMWRG